MLRLFFTAVVCALTLLPAGAQNKISETLLGLGEEERNEAFTDLLRDADVKCDRVIRTLLTALPRTWMCGRRCAEIEIRIP
jgi:hypothetical protein